MIEDKNKGIVNIVYNHLNLPVMIEFASGDKINYFYDATGKKTAKVVKQGQIEDKTFYYDGFQYKNNKLSFYPHAEGYVNAVYCTNCTEPEASKAKFNYVYQYKDHLGNIRMNYAWDYVDSTLKIIEESHYYPFGLKHQNYNIDKEVFEKDELINLTRIRPFLPNDNEVYKYKYNGKELQDELGLNMYDYGARNYDPAIGRWMNIDPLAEKYESNSPYIYAGNVPTRFVDYDGKDFGITIDHKNGTITINGNYYFNSQTEYDQNKDALQSWNNLSGTYITKDGIIYQISVKLLGIVVEEGENATEKAKQDSIGNVIGEASDKAFTRFERTASEDGETYTVHPGGVTQDGKLISNKNSTAITKTRSHEIGHTFGFGENDGGVMNYANSFDSMSLPTTSNLLSILKTPYKHFRSRGKDSLNSPMSEGDLNIGTNGADYNINVVGQYEGHGNFLDKGTIILKSGN